MIDAAWTGGVSTGTNTGGYTTASWVTGVGKGLTFTPSEGDTDKTLLFLNAGRRQTGGYSGSRGTDGRFWLTAQDPSSTSEAWYLEFAASVPSGQIQSYDKLFAMSLRCVRS